MLVVALNVVLSGDIPLTFQADTAKQYFVPGRSPVTVYVVAGLIVERASGYVPHVGPQNTELFVTVPGGLVHESETVEAVEEVTVNAVGAGGTWSVSTDVGSESRADIPLAFQAATAKQ